MTNLVCVERGRIEAIDLYQGVNYTPSIIIGDNVAMGNDVHIGVIGQLKLVIMYCWEVIFLFLTILMAN